MRSKNGLSMLSMVLYVFLFFSFTVFAATLSSNINYSSLKQKGLTVVNEDFDKLNYNLFVSAKDSFSVETIDNRLIFSNNDEYIFDANTGIILKNGGMLVTNVKSFAPVTIVVADRQLMDPSKYLSYSVTFEKYNTTFTREIFISVGDVLNE